MADDVLIYAYGLVSPEAVALTRIPAGLDDCPVELLTTPVCSVLVSRLPRRVYSPEAIEQSSGSVEWLSPRAMAHDRVLTWAQEHGGVVPLPMFSLFGSEDALTRSLIQRADGIARVFQRVASADEFGLRIHRRDEQMVAIIDALDPEIARLREQTRDAGPGQRYLLERKLADSARTAARTVSQRIAKEIYAGLRALSRDAVARPLSPDASRADGTLVLNGAFLVEQSRVNEFRAAVAAHMRAHEPHGLLFDFTGPWPPYNFVADAVGGDGQAAPS